MGVLEDLLHETRTALPSRIERLRRELLEAIDQRAPARDDRPVWYDLQYCAKRKGVSFYIISNTLGYQPRGAASEKVIHRRKMWTLPTIQEWLLVGDDDRKTYLSRFEDEMVEYKASRKLTGATGAGLRKASLHTARRQSARRQRLHDEKRRAHRASVTPVPHTALSTQVGQP